MEKIASFQVDHTKIGIGLYISRVDGDIVTYDVRMCKPNGGEYLEPAAGHTIEHLFATIARNSEWKDRVIYVGPMGCQTGFYLLLRGASHGDAIALTRMAMAQISCYEGEIPGNSEVECGNYLLHNLPGARQAVQPILEALEDYSEEMLNYSWHMKQNR